jgi:hypothetical protein
MRGQAGRALHGGYFFCGFGAFLRGFVLLAAARFGGDFFCSGKF